MTVADEISRERARQIHKEGWTAAHDDKHDTGELAAAAACYAATDTRWMNVRERAGIWPWHESYWKPKDRRRNLIRAGALIVAEIERLDRLRQLEDT